MPESMYMHGVHAVPVESRSLDPWELELQVVESHLVNVGN